MGSFFCLKYDKPQLNLCSYIKADWYTLKLHYLRVMTLYLLIYTKG